MDSQAVQFLQSLRGVQATIFLAFVLMRRAMTVQEMCDVTGLSDDAIRPAVRGLAAKELLFKQVGLHGKVTWLPKGDTFFGIRIAKDESQMSQNPLKPDSTPRGSKDSCSSSRGEVLALPLNLRTTTTTIHAESAKTGFCMVACDEAGIREPKRSEISNMAHVTPELIRAHVAQVKDEGGQIGTAIYRIINDWPLPAHSSGYVTFILPEPEPVDDEVSREQFYRMHHPEEYCSHHAWHDVCHEKIVPGTKFCAKHQAETRNE